MGSRLARRRARRDVPDQAVPAAQSNISSIRSGAMDVVGRWWNSSMGTMTRKDLFLRTESVWTVELRQGGADGRSSVHRFRSEADARAFVKRCQTGPGHWRDIANAGSPPTRTAPSVEPAAE
jgi:hypothetical protein